MIDLFYNIKLAVIYTQYGFKLQYFGELKIQVKSTSSVIIKNGLLFLIKKMGCYIITKKWAVNQ